MAIERKFVAQNLKEFRIKQFVGEQLSRVGLSDIKLQRTPLGDKILIKASRPGLVVGRAGSNIQKLTEALKEEFKLENPQIEIEEVANLGLDANIIAEMIVNSMERFGSARFKGVGHRAMDDVMNAGALGVEILISGKIPSQRAKTWRFYKGYLKKCGDVAITGVDIAYKTAILKSGAVGVKVSIMPPTTKLPDQIIIASEPEEKVDEVTMHAEAKELEAAVAAVEAKAEAEDAKPKKRPAKAKMEGDDVKAGAEKPKKAKKAAKKDDPKDVKDVPKNVPEDAAGTETADAAETPGAVADDEPTEADGTDQREETGAKRRKD